MSQAGWGMAQFVPVLVDHSMAVCLSVYVTVPQSCSGGHCMPSWGTFRPSCHS